MAELARKISRGGRQCKSKIVEPLKDLDTYDKVVRGASTYVYVEYI